MRRPLDERTDRFMRRRFSGFHDRSTWVWSLLRLNIASRDVERDLFRPFGVHKPDWDGAFRPWAYAWIAATVVVLALVAWRAVAS